MKINKSGAALSKIARISGTLYRLSQETGEKYLPLNRGVNMVEPIDLNRLVPAIDFNAPAIQQYPASAGSAKLREAINTRFFQGKTDPGRIFITAGGMNGLDVIVQTLDIQKLFLPAYYWGSYAHILNIRGVGAGSYGNQAELRRMLPQLKGNAVLICDPGNPLGEKYDDDEQFELLEWLNDHDIPVIFDSPYRRLFTPEDDPYYARLAGLPNVIICESFSKSLGLSGQRIGFVHSTDEAFNEEFHVRLMYCTNGINGFAQEIVWRLLGTLEGQTVTRRFRERTVDDIRKNIRFLREKGLLAELFYREGLPDGLFAVVRCTEEELLQHRIGSVSLSFFTKTEKDAAGRYARVCVSVPHAEFAEYFLPVNPTV